MSDGLSAGELIVRGEPVERTYARYVDNKLLVNRRYQRKLIWTLDEKVRFIDSILKGFPIPILLLAGSKNQTDGLLEIIDGMQRLNAIMSFIENEYGVNDQFFDLNSMALTKDLFDSGKLGQKSPKMDRKLCVQIASYVLPLSIYEFGSPESVDEVFRRINSGGKKLSRQELRAAGSTGAFAQAVRRISGKIRGDDSAKDVLTLNNMKMISITQRDLAYGIPVESLFWVQHGILTKEQVRESRDEELIADIVAQMITKEPLPSRSEVMDHYFTEGTDEPSKSRYNQIDAAVRVRGEELIVADFLRIYDQLMIVFRGNNTTFAHALFPDRPIARAPRYFQVVFLALHQQIVIKNRYLSNEILFFKKLRGAGDKITVQEGGGWGADQRENAIDAFSGIISRAFKLSPVSDPTTTHWVSRLENLLSQSKTEQSLYDFKQGFLLLDGSDSLDEGNFSNIMTTAAAIANTDPHSTGYILIGVADKQGTALRIKSLYNVEPIEQNGFYVCGIDHEFLCQKKTAEQYFQTLISKIKSSALSDDLKESVCQHAKLIQYYDKSVLILEIRAQSNVSSFSGAYFVRKGPSNEPVDILRLPAFIQRFLGGR
jgi:hypothetical protein